jgi:hypothetical protein
MRAILRDSQDGLGILRKNRIIGTCERRFWELFSITTLRLQLQDQVFLIVCPTRSDGSGKQGPNQEHVQGYYRKPSENCSEEKCKIRASHRGIVPLQRQKELPQNAPAHRRARRLASGHTLGMKTGRHREGKP